VLLLLLLVSLALSLFVSYPALPLASPRPLGVMERMAAVVGSMATMFRLTQPDFLLHSSFWVGFGWLDTMPGPRFQAVLVLLAAVTVAALLGHIASRHQVRRFLWLLVVSVGAAVSLGLYTLSTQTAPAALGGRYLIGWYLVVLAVIGTALSLDYRALAAGPEQVEAAAARRAALLLALAGPIHAYCLCFILMRHF
jgi:hypothetical protein